MIQETPEQFRVGLNVQHVPEFADISHLTQAAFQDLVLRSSENLSDELQQAMVDTLLAECPNAYVSQQRALVALYRDYLPNSACLNVMAEVGISRYLISSEAERARTFTRETFGEEIAAHFIIDPDFFDSEQLDNSEKIQEVKAGLQYMLQIRQKAADAYATSFTPDYHQSFLASFSFDEPGTNVENNPNSEYSKLKHAVGNFTMVLMSKSKLYGLCPGGSMLKRAYGENFWVMDLPCSGVILYTPEGYKNLSKSKELLESNIIHEEAHILFAHGLRVNLNDASGIVSLNGNLVLPDWFKEGYANVLCGRFKSYLNYDLDFLDLLLQHWDGTVPSSEEILRGDTNIPYFVYTLFVTYYFQLAGMNWQEWQRPECLAEPIPVNYLALFGLFTMFSRYPIGVDTTGKSTNISQLMLERNFEYMQYYLRHLDNQFLSVKQEERRRYIKKYSSPDTGVELPVISFEKFCQLFDEHRDTFARNWLKIYASEQQIQLILGNKQLADDPLVRELKQKRSEIIPPENSQSAEISHEYMNGNEFDRDQLLLVLSRQMELVEHRVQRYCDIATAKSGLSTITIDECRALFEHAPERMKKLFPAIPEQLWYFLRQMDNIDLTTTQVLPERYFLRMISEAVTLSQQIPVDPAQEEKFLIFQRSVKDLVILDGYKDYLNHPTEVQAIDYIKTYGMGIGRVYIERLFNRELVTKLCHLHFETLISLNRKVFDSKIFIEPFDGHDSYIGLFARAGGIDDYEGMRYDIMSKLTSLVYMFVFLKSYYGQVQADLGDNVLSVYEHSMFWAREHAIANVLLETERAEGLQNGMLAYDHILHEMLHFIICRVFHVAIQIEDKQFLFNAEGILPTAFHEGLANIFSTRYMISYTNTYDFTDLSDYFQTVPKILTSDEILRADTKTSYVHFTVFCSFVMQYIDALVSVPNIDPFVMLQVPSKDSIRRGGFWFIRANSVCMTERPLKVSKDFTGDIGIAYIRHVFEELRQMFSVQKNIQLPDFESMCRLFDQHKDDYWAGWKIEFAKSDPHPQLLKRQISRRKN